MGNDFGDFQEATIKTRGPNQGIDRGAVQEKMKSATKKDIIGNVANNPRYDRENGLDSGWDADTIKREKEKTLYGGDKAKTNCITKRLQEIYAVRYGYRQTASGRWRETDEPSEKEQLRQADAINKMMQRRKAAAGRDRLKAQNKVSTRAYTGKKLFEQFCTEAYKGRRKDINDADMRNILNAANHLTYKQWIWFVNDEYSGRI